MTATLVQNPYVPLLNLAGLGLNAGRVYVGVPDEDPQTDPKPVYWDQALTIPAAQPLDVLGGYIMRTGTPSQAYVDGEYSLLVTTESGQQVFYSANAFGFFSQQLANKMDRDGSNVDMDADQSDTFRRAIGVTPSFESLVELTASSIGADVQFLEVSGYSYVRSVGPAAAGKYQSADGAWWLLSEPIVVPQMFGVVGGGTTTDERAAMQNCIDYAADNGAVLNWNDVDIAVGTVAGQPGELGRTALYCRSGSNWQMTPNTKIRLLAQSVDLYAIVRLEEVENVVIQGNGATLVGDRATHIGVTGEYGMGVWLGGVDTVEISNLRAIDCWGDGFYLSWARGGSGKTFCENVKIRDCSGENNRRQGMSIESVESCLIDNFTGALTNGTAPAAGLDIEPFSATQRLVRLVVNNLNTSENDGFGLFIFLSALTNASLPVDIQVTGHTDSGSAGGAAFTSNGSLTGGNVSYVDGASKMSAASGMYVDGWRNSSPFLRIINPVVESPNQNGGVGPSPDTSGITIVDGGTAAVVYGNTLVEGASVSGANVYNPLFVADTRGAPVSFQNLTLLSPVRLSGQLPSQLQGCDDLSCRVVDDLPILVDMTDTNAAVDGYRPISLVLNDNFTGARDRFLDPNKILPAGWRVTFAVDVAQTLKIIPDVAASMRPLSTVAGKYVSSNTIGSTLTLVKVSDTLWRVAGQTGTWAVEP